MKYLTDLTGVYSNMQWLIDYYGIGATAQYYVAVTHNQKTAALYNHVRSAETHDRKYDFPMSWDAWYAGSGLVSVGGSCIAVNTGMRVMRVCGKKGSCFVIDGQHISVYNLYWGLLFMCSEIGINLLKYDKIWFYSTSRNYTTMIEFEEGRGSKLFRTKMWLDYGCSCDCEGRVI